MRPKPVVLREVAQRDIEEAVDHCLLEAGERVALDFVAALERTYRLIGRNPAAGSSRYALEVTLPGLRMWPLRRFPHLVFYQEAPDEIDIWRVLHGKRDIAHWLLGPIGA